jgi:hypothetical protein
MALKVAPDKLKHFIVGIPLGLFLQIFAVLLLPGEIAWAYIICFIVLVAICYGFELLSIVSGKGHADNLDAIAGIVGGVIGILLYFIWTSWL